MRTDRPKSNESMICIRGFTPSLAREKHIHATHVLVSGFWNLRDDNERGSYGAWDSHDKDGKATAIHFGHTQDESRGRVGCKMELIGTVSPCKSPESDGCFVQAVIYPEDFDEAMCTVKTIVGSLAKKTEVESKALVARILKECMIAPAVPEADPFAPAPKVPITTAQVHLAIETMRQLSDVPGANERVLQANAILYNAFGTKGWTGETETCPAFGLIAEESGATIQHLQDAHNRSANVIAYLKVFIQTVVDREEGPIVEAAQEALRLAERAAQGLPPEEASAAPEAEPT